ncbi:MAG: NADH-quinone oxidoreductase subunit D [Chloroflexi bacterium]|nr:NADH-quinone oxidoreductase subunit D [Chloroflexota bacterium]
MTEELPVVELSDLHAAHLQTEEMILNMGPQHPSTHGVLRLVLRLSGETVVECKPVMGYLHRGIEKIFENRTYLQGIRYTDQFDYLAAMLNEHAYVGAVEQLMGLEAPRRGEYIRVIVDELSRCTSHLVYLGTALLDLGAFTPIVYCFRDREEILDMFEELCGSRMNFNFHRVGGVLFDLPRGFIAKLADFLKRFQGNIDEYEELITGNEIFLARTVGVGIIPPDMGLAYGISGPNIRASGINFDIRTYKPYSAYPEIGVVPQMAEGGDAFARYEVRLAEMRESIRVIQRAIDGLPGGPVRARMPHVLRPPKGETYFSIESSKGELGMHLVSDGSIRPYRMKVRAPSFVNLQILPELLRDHKLGDVVAIFGSIDVVLGEVDR